MTRQQTSLVNRYKELLLIPDDVDITESMIEEHWALEKKLAARLLNSNPENRWKTTQTVYRTFYEKLTWLSEHAGESDQKDIVKRESDIIRLLGRPPQRIYEIGSGRGELIGLLAERGFQCRGGDIFPDRGLTEEVNIHENLNVGISDGVHLDRFEHENSYDVVLSDNVIEHLHPEDMEINLKAAHKILKKHGRYIIKTPHRFFGPHSLEQLFGLTDLQGFHLNEYTYRDFARSGKGAGFSRIKAVFLIPSPLKRLLGPLGKISYASKNYLAYLNTLELIVSKIKKASTQRILTQILRYFYFPRQVFVVLEK